MSIGSYLPDQRCRAGLAWNLSSVTREGTPHPKPIHRFQALLSTKRRASTVMVGTQRDGVDGVVGSAKALACAGQAEQSVSRQPGVRQMSGPGALCEHVVAGTQFDNMRRMARARRGGGRPTIRGLGREARRARSVAQREAIQGGVWDADALLGVESRLF